MHDTVAAGPLGLLDLLFDDGAAGRCLVSPDDAIVRVNAEWLRCTGLTLQEAPSAHAVDLFPKARDVELAMRARARAGHHVEVPRHARRLGGRESWWEGNIDPVPMEGGTGLLISLREVAAIRRPEEQAPGQRQAGRADPSSLWESEERFRVLTEALPQIVCVLAPDGTPEYVNRTWTTFSGLDLEASARQGWDGVLHPEDVPAARACIGRALRSLAPQEVELRYRAADGTYRWFLSRLAPLIEHGRVVRFVGAAMDIEASKRTQRDLQTREEDTRNRAAELQAVLTELRGAEERLRDAARRKDEFLSMLSHELRNPLAPIRNALYILDHVQPTGQEARRAKDVANRQVAHLARLVDDLLDVTRIARGKIELRHEDFDLAGLALRTADDYRPLMQDRGLDLAVHVPREPVIVNGDSARLTQVLGNLLNNAAKFTPAGGQVTLSLRQEADHAVVHVLDTGPGIAPEVLPTLFDPFTQGKQTLARSEGGLGLGLSLVRGLVKLHGGEVAVSTREGGGADFMVSLPSSSRRPSAAPRALAPPPSPSAAVRSHRVLVVDDNRDAAESLGELIRMLGHPVDLAYDGPSALKQADRTRPDIVLCDIGLPGMDGYAVAHALRAAYGKALRLIALSGYAQPEDVARAMDCGFDQHIAKPLDPGELHQLLA